MKRRNFLKVLPAAGVSSFAINGFSIRPFANSKIEKILADCDGVEDRALVLIQLKGGNDGLNMIIPAANFDRYAQLRPTTRISDTAYIPLDNTLPNDSLVGLHPAMTSVKAMYDNGMANVIQAVGYQSMNQSHFKGTDIWLSGADSSIGAETSTGWMGRALQAFYPDVKGAPIPSMPDPLGIQLGDPNTSLGFHTETEHQNSINLSGQDPAGFFSLIQTIGGAPILNVPDSDHGIELEFIMGVEQSINLYAARISEVFNAGSNAITTYPNNSLANQLKTVARMIKGGCKTKVFLCQIGGFDLHSAQVDSGDTGLGAHATLLQTLSDAVKIFFDDLQAMSLADRVLACTFSEFGRCAKENGSFGTDHGTMAPMMIFGKNAKAGVLGTNPDLNDLTTDNQIKHMQYDYRQVFGTLLQDWLGANPYVMEEAAFTGFEKIKLVDRDYRVDSSCLWGGAPIIIDGFKPVSIFPNPAAIGAEISIENRTDAAYTALVSLHSISGNLVASRKETIQPGSNFFYQDVSNLPDGMYFVRIQHQSTGKADVVKLSVAKGNSTRGSR
ncbi:MAG: DUF1501 domain-containing protein [Saprospiraceae bacterium]|nr:DUF1501 domain-containing protein [Saprospiraceae bacterium]